MSTRAEMWADLVERGFHCVYDGEYGPLENADAIPLFALYPRLMQKHDTGIWCTAPGLVLITAFRATADSWNDPRAIAAHIASEWDDRGIIALTESVGAEMAAVTIGERVLSDIKGASKCHPKSETGT